MIKVKLNLITLLTFISNIIFAGGISMQDKEIKLPEPILKGKISLEETIYKRRSIRHFKQGQLTLQHVSQLLWATQGITDKSRDFRAVPSAGATYPLEIYLFVGEVEGLKKGIYKYNPYSHSIIYLVEGDKRQQLCAASLFQDSVKKAQIVIVITAIFDRTTKVYGNRGIMYVHMEAGHCGQNIYLQAEALGLGTVAIGAFRDNDVKNILPVSKNEQPLYIFPVGLKQ
ncbi:MAG: SagB/ThcOx family dehydrogenase [Candidatus Goldbacteria bacterium]|nr:SagB/ThcOx family dehydrogenase [Candidatus Goldiibacteriota bacterium]